MKRKKREALKDQIREINELIKENEQGKFYAAINKIRKGFQPRINACRATDGEIIKETILKRWAQHFQDLLNEEESEPIARADEQILKEDTEDIPTLSLKQQSNRKIKNNRAPGDENITAELLKYGELRSRRNHDFDNYPLNMKK